MPIIHNGARVLVTGANGFIAMWVVRILLERGFCVRGTVRSTEKGKHVIEYFTSLGYGDKIQLVVVEDISKEGAFDEAIKGVDAIIHSASPVQFKVEDPQDFITPAVQGTLGILKSAVKSQVKRIVITSSISAVTSLTAPPGTVYTELDWNEGCIQYFKQLGKQLPPSLIYPVSKTLAEQGAWKFYEEHKSKVQWDLTTIIPPWVWGPRIQQVTSVSDLNFSMKVWYSSLLAEPQMPVISGSGGSWVDVRDCALGHVLSLEKSAAGGERMLIASPDHWVWQNWVDTVNMACPSLSCKLPPGVLVDEKPNVYDNSKLDRILGIEFRSKLETTKDIIEDAVKSGWFSKIANRI